MGKDHRFLDWKSTMSPLFKQQRDFKISSAKVLHYLGDAVGLKIFHSDAECRHTLLKRGWKISHLTLPRREYNSNKISTEKKREILHSVPCLRRVLMWNIIGMC
jgi:hypothetical protein